MTERIHDDEPDTSEPVARELLAAECPQWAQSPLVYLKTSGTDNAMWRVRLDNEPDLVLRLPRRPQAAAGVLQELAVLQQIETATVGSIVATPRVRHVGHPHERFLHNWSVLEWIDGTDAWTSRATLDRQPLFRLADDLARAVMAIQELSTHRVRQRAPGSRGGPLGPLLIQLDDWLDSPQWHARDLFDVDAVKRLADEAREIVDEPVEEGFVHGDLIPGNLLVAGDRLSAIIDWGGAGRGDTAQDLAPAWSVLNEAERPAFRESVGADDAAWIRGRTFELEHAVGGVLYYVPKQHPLGDVMARTLQRLLAAP
jgi:aminoglycoside phosphotransferase (APT) family kinase protein